MSRAILHVIEDLKPESGGPTTVVVELARQQAKSGHRVSVLCLEGPTSSEQRSRLQQSFESAGIRLLDLKAMGERRRPSVIASTVRAVRPDILHLHGVWSSLLRWSASAARAQGIKYVVSTHGMLHPDVLRQGRLKKWVYLTLFHRFLGAAQEILALNDEERRHVAQRFKRPSAVLANGISASQYQQATAQAFLEERPEFTNTSFALFVGRLHAIKGIDQLLRSFALARRRGLMSHIVIAGPDSGELASLQALAIELGVAETVHFVGPLYGASKLSALAGCSMFVHRPRFEGFGLSVLEALATGRPVVTTRRCLLDGAEAAGALRIAEDTDDAFAESMLVIERDPHLAAALAARGGEWSRARFDWAQVGREADAAYNRACQGAGSASHPR
ncbi:MAG: glycosyltransferase [bacterium]